MLSRGKKFVVKSIKKYDNSISIVRVEMTDDTKFLSDNQSDELTPEERAKYDAIFARVRAKRESGEEPSRVVKRLHHIWQMESEYFNNNPDAIKSADEAQK